MGPKTVISGLIGLAAFVALAKPADAFPWKAGDAAPVVRGVTLGQTEQQARVALGPPASSGKMSTNDVFSYANGLQIIANAGDGVSIIRLMSPQAGSYGGVKVGDAISAVLEKWGRPDVTAAGVDLYNAGVWTMEVKYNPAGKVTDLLLGWNSTKFGDTPPTSGQYYRPN